MSYDIYMFKKLEGKSVVDSSEEVLESDDLNALSWEDFEKQKIILTKELKDKNPSFVVYDSWECLELTLENEGIQIWVYNNQIAISMAFWHEWEEAENNFKKIFNYLKIISNETKYSIYDSQEDSEIELSQWIEKFLVSYGYGIKVTKDIINNESNMKTKKGFFERIIDIFK